MRNAARPLSHSTTHYRVSRPPVAGSYPDREAADPMWPDVCGGPMRQFKILAAAAAAALLAACGGGGSNTLPSAQTPGSAQPQSAGRHLTMLSKFTAVGDNGAILRIFPTREA